MVFEKILKLLMAHPRFGPQIINKIADSWPIRKAAKLTASVYFRGKRAIEEQRKAPTMSSKTSNSSEGTTGLNDFDVDRFIWQHFSSSSIFSFIF